MLATVESLVRLALLPLKILVLAENPISKIEDYRAHIISLLPKLERLDKEVITAEEREEAVLKVRRE